MRYKLLLSYSGKDFFGWQSQPEAPSVQETLENALHTLFGSPTTVVGAGRTDTGVSAVGYVAHFDAASEIDANWLLYKLNAILPPSIIIHEVSIAAPDFHARFDASRREYTYFLHRCKDPFADSHSYRFTYPALDFELMNRAAALLVARTIFRVFKRPAPTTKPRSAPYSKPPGILTLPRILPFSASHRRFPAETKADTGISELRQTDSCGIWCGLSSAPY